MSKLDYAAGHPASLACQNFMCGEKSHMWWPVNGKQNTFSLTGINKYNNDQISLQLSLNSLHTWMWLVGSIGPSWSLALLYPTILLPVSDHHRLPGHYLIKYIKTNLNCVLLYQSFPNLVGSLLIFRRKKSFSKPYEKLYFSKWAYKKQPNCTWGYYSPPLDWLNTWVGEPVIPTWGNIYLHARFHKDMQSHGGSVKEKAKHNERQWNKARLQMYRIFKS